MDKRSRAHAVLSKRIPAPPPALRVVIAIVLGAATTIAIAWLLALFVDASKPRWQLGFKMTGATQPTPRPQGAPDEVYWAQATRFQRWGTDIVELGPVVNGRSFGSMHAIVDGTSFAAEMKEHFDRGEAPVAWWRADGWPLLALSAESRWRSYDSERVRYVIGGVLVGSKAVSPGDAVRILPLQPIWTGFVIDTLLFGSLWFAILSHRDSIRFFRSRLRRRRGQCVRCGYKLMQEQTRCSECAEQVC